MLGKREKSERKFRKFCDDICQSEGSADARESFWSSAETMLSRIPDEELMQGLGMQDMSRIIYVLQKKHSTKAELIPLANDMEIRCADTVIGRASYQSVVIHFIKIEDHILTIEGESSVPVCFDEKEASVYVLAEEKCYKTLSLPRKNDKKIWGEIYEYCRTFRFVYRLSKRKSIRFRFLSRLNGMDVEYRAVVGMRFSPIASQVLGQYAQLGGYLLRIEENEIQCFPNGQILFCGFEHGFQKRLGLLHTEEAYRAIRFREYYFYYKKKKKNQIWIFSDRIDKADDNGEALFRYVMKNRPHGVEAYFIIDGSSEDYRRLFPMGHIVKANSYKHQMLHAMADYIFTSQANGFIENPFGKGEIYYRDLEHQAKVIFLQHGVTKDDQTGHFNRFNQDFYAFITSSPKETASLIELPYFYKAEQIWQTGMPRLDLLYHDEKRQVLIMPTWRKRLMKQEWNPKLKVYSWKPTGNLQDSLYCRTYRELLNSARLKAMSERTGYQILFVLHPLMMPYSDVFDVPTYMKKVSYEEVCLRKMFAESDLMITDYSSVAFDFAYLKKPILYYQFDKEEFFGSHTYKKGYFSYEKDGFGEVVEKEPELLDLLERYLADNGRMKAVYEKRVKQFFGEGEKNCCKQIIDRVMQWRD